jgi:hypothetical protein
MLFPDLIPVPHPHPFPFEKGRVTAKAKAQLSTAVEKGLLEAQIFSRIFQ